MGKYVYKINDPYGGSYTAWELNHVTSMKFSIKKELTTYGLPTKSTNATQSFEMKGPVQQISISFVRFDYEEPISNWDFMYKQNINLNGKLYKGIDWYTSRMQTTRPYKFAIQWVPDYVGDTDPECTPTGIWNVSITGIDFQIDNKNMGMATFSIDMVERRT